MARGNAYVEFAQDAFRIEWTNEDFLNPDTTIGGWFFRIHQINKTWDHTFQVLHRNLIEGIGHAFKQCAQRAHVERDAGVVPKRRNP